MSDMSRGTGSRIAMIGLATAMAGGIMVGTAGPAAAAEWRLHGAYRYKSVCKAVGKVHVKKRNSPYTSYKCTYNKSTTFKQKYWLYLRWDPKGVGVKG